MPCSEHKAKYFGRQLEKKPEQLSSLEKLMLCFAQKLVLLKQREFFKTLFFQGV